MIWFKKNQYCTYIHTLFHHMIVENIGLPIFWDDVVI